MNKISYDDEIVLVVDDDEMVRESTAERLRHIGFQADAFDNGFDALEALGKKPYNFLLSDIQMPGMSGLELIKRTKAKYPDVIIIAMTGYIEDHTNVDVLGLGAIDFIKKPFSIKELEARIRHAIINRNLNQKQRQPATTDSLTGLYNHEHFFNQLGPQVLRAKQDNRPLGLILIELDEFELNDETHGNLEENKLLHKVGRIIKASIRDDLDSGYRYGGIDFAIILTNSDPGNTDTTQKQIKKAILTECKLEVCIGFAQYSNDLSPRIFFMKVDNYLSMAKNKKTENSA